MKKNILILHIFESDDEKYTISDKNFCDSNIPIKYDLIYIPVQYSKLERLMDELKDLIENSLDFMYRTVVFCNVHNEQDIDILIRMIQEITFKNTVMYLKTSTQISPLESVEGIKIINAVGFSRIETNQALPFYRKSLNGSEYILVDYFYFSEDIRTLECAWWFNMFINKVFDCGKKRLQQFSGTCYINSVLNGFILSKNLSKLISSELKKLIASPTTPKPLLDYITSDIVEQESCPFYDGSSSNYLLHLFYNILENPPFYSGVDIMTGLDEKYHIKTKSNTGGNPEIILKAVLNTFQIPHLNFTGNFVQNGEVNDAILLTWTDIDYTDVYYLKETVWVGYQSFDLEFAVIGIDFPDEEIGHAVCGFICDGVHKIYDSSTNYIHTVHWPTIISNPDSFIKKASELWGREIINLRIEVLVYTKNLKGYKSDMSRIPGKLKLPRKKYENGDEYRD